MLHKFFLFFTSVIILFSVSVTPIFAQCCTGNPGCGNFSGNFDDCIIQSCNWVCGSPTKCCTGNPGCGNLSNSYENCIDQSCTWTCGNPTAAPLPISTGGLPLPTNPPPPPVFCKGNTGVNTGLGCAPIDGTSLINMLLRWGVIVGAGIAILLIGFAGFEIATATGDPKKMRAGQELLISALAGLVLISLAIVIINFLGFTVLKLPI